MKKLTLFLVVQIVFSVILIAGCTQPHSVVISKPKPVITALPTLKIPVLPTFSSQINPTYANLTNKTDQILMNLPEKTGKTVSNLTNKTEQKIVNLTEKLNKRLWIWPEKYMTFFRFTGSSGIIVTGVGWLTWMHRQRRRKSSQRQSAPTELWL